MPDPESFELTEQEGGSFIATGTDDLGAFADKEFRGGQTDGSGTASDEGNLVSQSHHGCLFGRSLQLLDLALPVRHDWGLLCLLSWFT